MLGNSQSEARIDNMDMFSFVMEPQLVDLLVCAREGIRLVLENTLAKINLADYETAQPQYDGFLMTLNRFLSHSAVYV